jgi:hypothetical protein
MRLIKSFYCWWGKILLVLSVAKVKKEMLRRPQLQNDFNLILN